MVKNCLMESGSSLGRMACLLLVEAPNAVLSMFVEVLFRGLTRMWIINSIFYLYSAISVHSAVLAQRTYSLILGKGNNRGKGGWNY